NPPARTTAGRARVTAQVDRWTALALRGRSRLSGQSVEEIPVALICEQLRRSGQRDPANGVDLVVWSRFASLRAHQPVADLFELAPACDVRGRGELGLELTAEAGLLLDLSQRARLVGLTGFDLSLGKRPVVSAEPMDEQQLRLALVHPPHDDASGCPHARSSGHGPPRRLHEGDNSGRSTDGAGKPGEVGSPPAPDRTRRLAEHSSDDPSVTTRAPRAKNFPRGVQRCTCSPMACANGRGRRSHRLTTRRSSRYRWNRWRVRPA